ncbi:MAG: hypothetical protein HYW48_08290 [Deltaproteobacteria bacterium]|nr:hypothetical protein [Deltaproteobacteria bacterium]
MTFKPEEDSVFVVLKSSDPLVKNIEPSVGKTVVRGTTEFRILKQEGDITVLHALDLRPKLVTEKVQAAIDNGEIVIPSPTFRSDPQFKLKTGIVEAFGKKSTAFSDGSRGTISMDDKTYVYEVDRFKNLSGGQLEFIAIFSFMKSKGCLTEVRKSWQKWGIAPGCGK